MIKNHYNTNSDVPSNLNFPKTLWSFIIHFSKPYAWYFFSILLALSLVALITNAWVPAVLQTILDQVATFNVSKGQSHLFRMVVVPCISYVVLSELLDLFWRFYDYLTLKSLPSIKKNLIAALFDYISLHSYSYFQNNFAGGIANRISDMARGVENILIIILETAILQILSLLVATWTMYQVHPYFAYWFLLWLSVFVANVYWQSKKGHALSQIFSESRTKTMGKIVDVVGNIMCVKLFSRRGFESRYLARYLSDNLQKDQGLQAYMIVMKLIQGIQVSVLLLGFLTVLIKLLMQGQVSVGDFGLMLSLSASVVQGLWYLASHFVMFAQEVGTCHQALSLVTAGHEIPDHPEAGHLKVPHGEILFDKVSFHYERGKNIFRDKTIKILGGQKVGLVGFSGSGKTTFVNLILRFFDVAAGRILIDGQDISQITQDSLRSQIAVIPQDPLLFHRSLLENIRYGRLEASDEEVMEASRKAHAHDFIEKLDQGYQRVVGERGVKLSGGQKQRIAIARAILKNAPILILDEATSSLDSVTEKKIQESVAYVMQNRTSIVIAHRLSTLSDMDRILVFSGGQVVEDGTHDELIAIDGGHYSKLWTMQAGGFLPEKPNEEE